MSPARGIEALLFWIMTILGALVFIPGLLVPPWLEYQAAREAVFAREQAEAELDAQILKAQKQKDALRNDPAYMLRIAQREFGYLSLGTETVLIEPGTPEPNPAPAAAAGANDAALRDDAFVPEVSALLDRVFERYPYFRIFARPQTRPLLMGMGALLVLCAIVLLGRPARAARSKPSSN